MCITFLVFLFFFHLISFQFDVHVFLLFLCVELNQFSLDFLYVFSYDLIHIFFPSISLFVFLVFYLFSYSSLLSLLLLSMFGC